MTILSPAGPPAMGHNTIAERLARRRERVALIDVTELCVLPLFRR